MKNLFVSEFQRLWYRKSTLLCFLAIPVILIASAKYYLGVNARIEITNPQFTSIYNFPAAAIQEQLILAFNIIVTLLIVLSVTAEIRDGSLRMVLIRRFKPTEIFVSKFLVIVVTIFMFLLVYFVLAYIVGFFIFPKINQVSLFYFNRSFNGLEVFIYTIKYYLLSFLTLIAISALVYFIATISKSVIIALGLSVGSILTLIVYPTALQIFTYGNQEMAKFQLLSMTQIQYQGIAMMLGEHNIFFMFNIMTILSYILIFFGMSYLVYRRCDNLI